MNDILLSAKNVNFRVQHLFSVSKLFFIQNLNFNLYQGDFINIIGPNGSGKTTILKILSGVIKIFNGKIFIKDEDIKNIDSVNRVKMIAIMQQNFHLYIDFTVRQILAMGRVILSNNFKINSKDNEIILSIINVIGINNLIEKKYNILSSGQKQKVMLAIAMIQQSKILLLDEPFSSIDTETKLIVMHFLKEINKKYKVSIVIVDHSQNILNFYNRKITINNGQIISDKR